MKIFLFLLIGTATVHSAGDRDIGWKAYSFHHDILL